MLDKIFINEQWNELNSYLRHLNIIEQERNFVSTNHINSSEIINMCNNIINFSQQIILRAQSIKIHYEYNLKEGINNER